ncbi:ATPase domain-containing protein (plasmid) [Rhizobium etli bv. mimosae str. IE4771]|uniref:ATPase domain-containing protein n=2 Tax=Rhizobium etli TaxID=29449 RepID=A0A060IC40_RHIET|nr:ATPase domain-containing protein [Rhizobium sp. IE4771]
MEGFSLIGRGTADRDKTLKERQTRVDQFFESNEQRAETYFVTAELEKAVDVALTLGRPLLLTGEPGSGKTLAAFWVASKLGLPKDHFHEFQVRSDSRAIDICYNFDAVSWFRQSQIASAPVEKSDYIEPRELGLAFGWREPEMTLPHVVLIDEIDKAPRDFPNDLLLELDQMKFKILETGRVIGPPAVRPIIIITSNSERRLPDPFLRRCITHHIEITFDTVKEILKARLAAYRKKVPGGAKDQDLVQAGATFYSGLSALEGRLSRKPTVAEFWQWLILASEYPDSTTVDLVSTLSTPRGPMIEKLPRINALFVPSDLKVVSNG